MIHTCNICGGNPKPNQNVCSDVLSDTVLADFSSEQKKKNHAKHIMLVLKSITYFTYQKKVLSLSKTVAYYFC